MTDPKTLEDAVGQILVQLTPANIMDIEEVEEEFSMICLNGMAMRNDWNLWYKSDLSMWFYNHGIYHADDMSGTICKAVWCSVKNLPFVLENEVKYFEEYWKETNSDVKSQFEERCKI